jgi:diaminopimelate decarboxylase
MNLGGGFKVARMPGDKSTNVCAIGTVLRKSLKSFADQTGRKLKLEIEPGTFMMANSGVLVATIQDIVSTTPGSSGGGGGGEREGDGGSGGGHEFLKLDAGMTEILRPSLYGALHPLAVVPATNAYGALPSLSTNALATNASGPLCMCSRCTASIQDYCWFEASTWCDVISVVTELMHITGLKRARMHPCIAKSSSLSINQCLSNQRICA